MKTGPVIGRNAGADFRPSPEVRANRTSVLVQRASRADGPMPSAEMRHPWIGRRPASDIPSYVRPHAMAYDGRSVNPR